MPLQEFQEIKQQTLFEAMVKLGCPRANVPTDTIFFDSRHMPRLTKAKQVELCRLVRQCVLMERQGTLVANIDRMGKVTGWHKAQIRQESL